jgi:hypothetical protein
MEGEWFICGILNAEDWVVELESVVTLDSAIEKRKKGAGKMSR